MKEKYGFEHFTAGMKLATTIAFLTLTGIGGTAIWQASSQVSRIDGIEQRVDKDEQTINDSAKTAKDNNDRLITLEIEVGYIKKNQNDFKADYEKDMDELKQSLKEIVKEVKKP